MKKCSSIEVESIETLGLLDGPGVRVVVFLSHCGLRCVYCHNPESWFCKGDTYSWEELYKTICKYKNYIENGGVTFSGGEPLLQSHELLPLFAELKKNNINIAIDTAGYVQINADVKAILDLTDLIILDIKAISSEKYKAICGGNIKMQEDFINYINGLDKAVWLRQVIVPGINDTEEYIAQFNEYIKRINNITKVELLGYHSMAKSKYKSLGIEYPLKDVDDMDKSRLNELSKLVKFTKKD